MKKIFFIALALFALTSCMPSDEQTTEETTEETIQEPTVDTTRVESDTE